MSLLASALDLREGFEARGLRPARGFVVSRSVGKVSLVPSRASPSEPRWSWSARDSSSSERPHPLSANRAAARSASVRG
jgi:hypothetical protein